MLLAGPHLRSRSPSLKRLSAVPSCTGLITRAAAARARDAGIDLRGLLRKCRLTLADIEDEGAPIGVNDQIKCLNAIAAALHDRMIGFHVALDLDLRRIGVLYYVVASSDTFGEALQRAARYSVIVNEGIGFDALPGKTPKVRFKHHGVSRLSDRQQIEAWVTLMVRTSREVTGRAASPAVRLMHRRIPESAELDAFLGRAIEFGADRDEIVFPADLAGAAIVSADPYLNRILTAGCEAVLARRTARPAALRTNVENALAPLLPHGHARLDAVARKLGLSGRTLRRKLADEGVTFAGVLKDLRYDLARLHLADRGLSVSRIAWLLGYTEVSAFSHAYRRWSGRAPRAGRPRRGDRRSVRPRRARRS